MAEVKWTEQQWDAICDRDGSLLVSAAAGSGKTAVLVERLLKRIEEEQETLSRFLMITYTKAAASELRAKIAKALSKRIANDLENQRLIRESNQLHNAKIQTVHAFCSSLIRTHGYLLGLPSEFRILDESESDMIRRNILDDLMESWYAKNPIGSLPLAKGYPPTVVTIRLSMRSFFCSRKVSRIRFRMLGLLRSENRSSVRICLPLSGAHIFAVISKSNSRI